MLGVKSDTVPHFFGEEFLVPHLEAPLTLNVEDGHRGIVSLEPVNSMTKIALNETAHMQVANADHVNAMTKWQRLGARAEKQLCTVLLEQAARKTNKSPAKPSFPQLLRMLF